MTAALDELRRVAETTESGVNIMPATVALARAGGTTGEWAGALREVFGEYRAPTGVGAASGGRSGDLASVAARVKALAGGPPRLLVAKPGLDGHSNGAEQIAVAARDAGMEVVYSGIRLTPEQIAASARDEDPDVIGLSMLSGSHRELVPEVLAELASRRGRRPGGGRRDHPRGGPRRAAGRRGPGRLHAEGLRAGRIMDDIAHSHRGAPRRAVRRRRALIDSATRWRTSVARVAVEPQLLADLDAVGVGDGVGRHEVGHGDAELLGDAAQVVARPPRT